MGSNASPMPTNSALASILLRYTPKLSLPIPIWNLVQTIFGHSWFSVNTQCSRIIIFLTSLMYFEAGWKSSQFQSEQSWFQMAYLAVPKIIN
jgi:hypothetical protein